VEELRFPIPPSHLSAMLRDALAKRGVKIRPVAHGEPSLRWEHRSQRVQSSYREIAGAGRNANPQSPPFSLIAAQTLAQPEPLHRIDPAHARHMTNLTPSRSDEAAGLQPHVAFCARRLGK
jgi:hypothetical protein